MKIFTIKTINPLGDYDEEWGQTFWATTHEQAMPIKFTKQITYIPNIGSKVVAEEYEVKEGKKGEFMSLRKVKLEGSGSQEKQRTEETQAETPATDLMLKLEEIHVDIKRLLGE